MSALAQTAIALLLVGAAVGYLGARIWRTIVTARTRKAGACGANCGCE